jgi:predicted ATPase
MPQFIEAFVLWFQGYPEQAFRAFAESEKIAEEIDHPFTTNMTIFYCATASLLEGNALEAKARAVRILEISRERHFPLYSAVATALFGWATAKSGQSEAGIADLRRGISQLRSLGLIMRIPCYLGLLAECYGEAGSTTRAFDTIEEALAVTRKSEHPLWEPEIHRVKGDLLKAVGKTNEAAESYITAGKCAERIGAKILELRAAVARCRLEQGDARREISESELRPLYDTFTEGFQMHDLIAAAEILNEP